MRSRASAPSWRRGAWLVSRAYFYRAHTSCEAVVAIEQQRVEIRFALRGRQGWTHETLSTLGADLILPSFGLRCTVGDVYANTHLRPRPRAFQP